MSSVFDNDIEFPGMYDVFDDYDDTAANDRLWSECKQRVIKEHKEKKQITQKRTDNHATTPKCVDACCKSTVIIVE